MDGGRQRVGPGLEKGVCYCQLWNVRLSQQRFSQSDSQSSEFYSFNSICLNYFGLILPLTHILDLSYFSDIFKEYT
jgi:hypothetical protein